MDRGGGNRIAAALSYHRIGWYETIHALVLVTALSFLVFVSAGARGIWVLLRRRQHAVNEPGPVRAQRYVLLGLCATGAAFAVGYTVMVLTNPDYFRYPPGTSAMLVLPVMEAVLTAVALILVSLAWIKRYGTPWGRLGNTVIVLTPATFLWVLDMWHVLGWRL